MEIEIDQETIYGKVYVVEGHGIGNFSFHFDQRGSYEDNSIYLSRRNEKFDNSDKDLPKKWTFDNEHYNPETRTFTGILNFGARTLKGANRLEYEIQFSENLKLIENGKCKIKSYHNDDFI